MDAASHPPAGRVPVFGWNGRAGWFRWSTNWGRSSWGLLLAGLLLYTFIGTSPASTIRVPQDYSTIQAAINAAQDGDTVLVSPGTYAENPVISGKSVILASEFHTTGDPGKIGQTVIDGQSGAATIAVAASAGPDTRITGFTIQNAADGIRVEAPILIDNNRIIDTHDAIDYEGGGNGGICRDNLIENNTDDAVDLDRDTGLLIENNILRNNNDDGIEIRLHAYSGATLEIVIRDNEISGNGEDGIQLIDYSDLSDRVITIERNRITGNAMVGLGLMDNGETVEDFRAAPIPERIHLFNNTFTSNDYHVTGGANLIALNNIFAESSTLALKNLVADSIAAYNLFWNNPTDFQGSNLDMDTTVFADPLLNGQEMPQAGSPAIDAGTAYFLWNGEVVLDMSPADYNGLAPDLGWYETDYIPATETPSSTPSPTATSTPLETATSTAIPSSTNTPPPTETHTPLPSPTDTPLPSPTETALPTATNTAIPSSTNTPPPTETHTPLPSPTDTPLPSPTETALPTATDTALPTATSTAMPSSTNTPPPTETHTPLPSPTDTALPTATDTPLPSPTETALPTATDTAPPTATNTAIPSSTHTPPPSPTNTALPTATDTALPTATSTPLPTATDTALPTATSSPLPTATDTALPTATNTPPPTASSTPLPSPTNTPLPTSTNTPPPMIETLAPTATNTSHPTATHTHQPLATNTPLPYMTMAPTATFSATDAAAFSVTAADRQYPIYLPLSPGFEAGGPAKASSGIIWLRSLHSCSPVSSMAGQPASCRLRFLRLTDQP